jgi:uncharacterized membrane protein
VSAANTRLVIGPNASLTGRQAVLFFGWMALVSLAVAGFFTAFGFWPVLPFAGLELLALGVALRASLRRNRYREVVEFCDERIRVEFGMTGVGAALAVELPRSPTRVLLERGSSRNAPTRLLLSCMGQRVEMARCLTDEERERLAERMRQLIHPGWAPARREELQPAPFDHH